MFALAPLEVFLVEKLALELLEVSAVIKQEQLLLRMWQNELCTYGGCGPVGLCSRGTTKKTGLYSMVASEL